MSKPRDRQDLDRPRAFLNDRMRDIDREVTRRAGRAVARTGIRGLSSAHDRLMAELGQGARPSQLAERLGITKAAVGQLVRRLERMGLLERTPDPIDGRAFLVRPTSRAQAAYRTARSTIMAIEDEWTRRLGKRRMAVVEESLTLLERWADETRED